MLTDLLSQQLDALNIRLSEEIKRKLLDFDHSLMEANNETNLIGYKTVEERSLWLYCESLWAAKNFNINNRLLVDIGSGNGFPGIAFSWMQRCDLLLLESRKQRILFLEKTIKEFNYDRVQTRQSNFSGKTEYVVKDNHRSTFCWRAVSLGEKVIDRLFNEMKKGDQMLCFFGEKSKDFPIIQKLSNLRILQKKAISPQ